MTLPLQLPPECDLAQLGLSERQITRVELLHRRRINWVYRLWCGQDIWILKWLVEPTKSRELAFYRLLSQCGVPVLDHRIGERALLLDDVEHSQHWRLAEETDAQSADTGQATAAWYKTFHEVGRRLIEAGDPRLDGLDWEFDGLSAQVVRSVGERLALRNEHGWRLAEQHVEELVAKARTLPMTLNYNDFHWSNVALARTTGSTARGIVFDYHLAGVGLAYSDWRNVLSCLRGRAAEAFRDVYGPVDDAQALLDRPLALVHGLKAAAESPIQPKWADGLIGQVRRSLLEHWVRDALVTEQ